MPSRAKKKVAKKPARRIAKKPVRKPAAKKPAVRMAAPKAASKSLPGGIPEGFTSLTPYLTVHGAADAIDFYTKAFGAVEMERHMAPGTDIVMNAHLVIGDTAVMLSDEMPQAERFVSPRKLGGTAVCLHLYVPNVDAVFNRAVAAGATSIMPVQDTFWGDRYGQLADPFGHVWSIATAKRKVPEAEMQKAAAELFAGALQVSEED